MAENDLDQGGDPGDTPDFSSIKAQAAAADSDRAAGEVPPAAGGGVALPDNTPEPYREIAGMLYAAGQFGAVRWPSIGPVYTEDRCTQTAQALDPVLQDLGWYKYLTGEGAGKMFMYLAALGAVVSLGRDTVTAIRADEEKKAAELQKNTATSEGVASGS